MREDKNGGLTSGKQIMSVWLKYIRKSSQKSNIQLLTELGSSSDASGALGVDRFIVRVVQVVVSTRTRGASAMRIKDVSDDSSVVAHVRKCPYELGVPRKSFDRPRIRGVVGEALDDLVVHLEVVITTLLACPLAGGEHDAALHTRRINQYTSGENLDVGRRWGCGGE
jgi:hypothetical protein